MTGPAPVAIAGVHCTPAARRIDRSSASVCLEAVRGALDDAGMTPGELDGFAGRWPGPGGTIFHPGSVDWATLLDIELSWMDDSYPNGIPAVMNAAAAIAAGYCRAVCVVGGQAGVLGSARVATYTRPANEFVACWGAYTATHFALVAQQYLTRYPHSRGTVAQLAASIRNAGSRNPEAVMHGRGPYEAPDVLDAPLVAEPLTLLDLCLANEGAAAMIITGVDRARDARPEPVVVLGAGAEWRRQEYVDPPRYDDVGSLGTRAAERAFRAAGVAPSDVDVLALYDVTSFEAARQLEVLGYCGPGEGADFALEAGIEPGGALPLNTDGGLLAGSHIGEGATSLRVIEAVHQLRRAAGARQVPDAAIACVTGAGAGAHYQNVLVLGRDRTTRSRG